MNTANLIEIDRRHLFRVRRGFLLAFSKFLVTLIAVLCIPDFVSQSHDKKVACLSVAGLSLLAGWVFLIQERRPPNSWRAWIALITAVYLTLFLPAAFIEISPFRWLTRHNPMHHAFSAYVSPWIIYGYHGFIFVLAGIFGSLFGVGRARVAFYIGSVLLMILYFATNPWIR
jgi:hypothetical protein